MYFPKRLFQGLLALSFLLSGTGAFAQKSRDQLEKEKQDNQQKINQIQGVLKKTTSQKGVNLKQLQVINSQISAQKKQINLINDDLKLLDQELVALGNERRRLDSDMERLKKEYAKMIYEASKRNISLSGLIFLFSASTFNQFVVRYKYLRQYTDARQNQARQMESLQRQIKAQQDRIAVKKGQQKSVLDSRISEAKKLEVLQGQKNSVVVELSKQEVQLKEELAQSRRQAALLESSIRRLIEREMKERAERERRERLAREKAEKALKESGAEPAPASPDLSGMTDEEVKLASSFTASKARLPWPVRGFVSDHFGRQEHPVFKGIVVENLGIDIQTNAGEPVKVVYDGLVLDINTMAGFGYVVAVQHGDYMTVYAKLKSVSVRPGQRVKARDNIGVVSTNSEGTSELMFQIWKNTTKLNPEAWLLRR